MRELQDLEIANIVASGKLNIELDLASVSEDLRDLDEIFTKVEHSRKNGNRLLIYFEENDALGILVPSGAYVFNGVNTFEEIEDAREKLLKGLNSLGIVSGIELSEEEIIDEFAVQNIVCTADIGEDLNLNTISIGLGFEKTEYEPEQSPGLIYRPHNSNCTLLIFGTGKVIITGEKEMHLAQKSFDDLIDELEKLEII